MNEKLFGKALYQLLTFRLQVIKSLLAAKITMKELQGRQFG
ncbi:hypothetical protein [Dyadobacter sp. CY326]|nr:hypothetical protein [Dyadobacter sp. CY326]